MHILVTGANGFVGAQLVKRLTGSSPPLKWTRLTLLDLDPPPTFNDPRIICHAADLAEGSRLSQALEVPADVVFHLASIPGGAAERHFEKGRLVNLDAVLKLFNLLERQEKPARVVYASTVAVYGAPLPAEVGEDTPMRPNLSYGAHKLIGEVLLADASRRGTIDGIALRLPGIVARPPQPSGLLSAFMSDLFWKLRDGEEFVCPVGAKGTAWWMSVDCCVDNLLHAAQVSAKQLGSSRAMTLPVLHLSMEEVISGVDRYLGRAQPSQVIYRRDPVLEKTFAAFPPISTPTAIALGFVHDGSASGLIARVLDNAPSPHASKALEQEPL